MKHQSPYIKYLHQSILQEFILESNQMRSIMKVVNQVAKYDVNVLITGESGTGKELLAKIIHLQSQRVEHPFVPVNCGILSGLMFEDKLFGHEKGAFTGAIDRKSGCFEMADKGTLFLDEIADIPLENQGDFLRVLEDSRFSRIGSNDVLEVDIRIISATNKDLKSCVKLGVFREDLFYRLQIVPIFLPPLQERREAIPKMTDHFLTQFETAYMKPKPRISSDVMNLFSRYEWPGNVRELKNLLERVFIVNNDNYIGREHLPSDFMWHYNTPPSAMDLEQVKQRAETSAIIEALQRVGGDREKAAKILRISSRTLRYKLNRYGIQISRKGTLRSDIPG